MALTDVKEKLRGLLESPQRYKVIAAIVILAVLLYFLWPSQKPPVHPPVDNPPLVTSSETTVSVVPKTSPTDNDLEVQHVYTVQIGTQKVVIPQKDLPASPNGNKAVVKTETDFTPVVRQLAEKEFKKNWELSVGFGVEKGNPYVPLGVQRNYRIDRAWAAEVHLDANELRNAKLKASGWEVKHVWKF